MAPSSHSERGNTVAVDRYTGSPITQEGAAKIKERRAGKAELLAEMRADRANAALDRHSHVGAELGRSVAELEGMRIIYRSFADLSNALIVSGYEYPAGTVASLARGVQRAAMEYYGKEAAESLGDISQPGGEAPRDISQGPTVGDISQPDKYAHIKIHPTEPTLVVSQPEAERAVEAATQSFGKPQPMAPLTKADASPVTPLAVFEDDDGPEDMPGADEAVVSPEVEESPRVRAARQRREAKRAAKANVPQ